MYYPNRVVVGVLFGEVRVWGVFYLSDKNCMHLQSDKSTLKVGVVQMAPVLLNRAATLEKMRHYAERAGQADCGLLVFSEALLPGYPFWLDFSDGARFNANFQKRLHARYLREAVSVEAGHLEELTALARQYRMAMYVGIMERPADRGGHSLYCTLVFIDAQGEIRNRHRKLRPTYEERLSWAPGDGHGLRTFPVGPFTVGGLNCWENWMPLARAALYGMGENLHVMVWPGNYRNTHDLTPVVAKESRSFVISASGLFRKSDIPTDWPESEVLRAQCPEQPADGGSCIASPDGSWVLPPQRGTEELFTAAVDLQRVLEERQNFDPSGHYSRPDVLRLQVDRRRQAAVHYLD